MKNKFLKMLLIISGFFFLGLGVIGAFLPIMPTVPFILLSAACFARGSDKYYQWLISHKLFGPHIIRYREGKGVSKRLKISSIIMLWISLSVSTLLFIHNNYLRVFFLLILILITLHILRIKTYKK